MGGTEGGEGCVFLLAGQRYRRRKDERLKEVDWSNTGDFIFSMTMSAACKGLGNINVPNESWHREKRFFFFMLLNKTFTKKEDLYLLKVLN